jgi:hypothetical protein
VASVIPSHSCKVFSRLTGQVRNSFQRWGQPGQQQGRRIPSLSSVRTRSMCCLLVSGLLTETTQQIHSFRASGVISSHFARAAGSEMRAFRKSAGTACTAPREITLLVMDFSLYPIGAVLVQPPDPAKGRHKSARRHSSLGLLQNGDDRGQKTFRKTKDQIFLPAPAASARLPIFLSSS